MQKSYHAYWRRKGRFFFSRWKKEGPLRGHRFDKEQNKMVIYFFEDGSIKEICDWTRCEMHLRQDFILFEKSMTEEKIGQPINVV